MLYIRRSSHRPMFKSQVHRLPLKHLTVRCGRPRRIKAICRSTGLNAYQDDTEHLSLHYKISMQNQIH